MRIAYICDKCHCISSYTKLPEDGICSVCHKGKLSLLQRPIAYSDMRFPVAWFLEMARTINSKDKWVFTSNGGNKLFVAKRVNDDGTEVLDFEYNPGD